MTETNKLPTKAIDLSTASLRDMVTRHARAIDARATLEDMPEALAFQIDMARALLSEFSALQSSAQVGQVPDRMKVTEEMHQAACKVLARANGLDGLPQRMLDAMLAVAPAQAQGVQEDAARWRMARDLLAPSDIEEAFKSWSYSGQMASDLISASTDKAIDAAMLAAK